MGGKDHYATSWAASYGMIFHTYMLDKQPGIAIPVDAKYFEAECCRASAWLMVPQDGEDHYATSWAASYGMIFHTYMLDKQPGIAIPVDAKYFEAECCMASAWLMVPQDG